MLCVRLVEETCISVLALGYFPHIEALCHHHHTHLVADIQLPRAGCVVRRAYGIAPHLLEQAHNVVQIKAELEKIREQIQNIE